MDGWEESRWKTIEPGRASLSAHSTKHDGWASLAEFVLGPVDLLDLEAAGVLAKKLAQLFQTGIEESRVAVAIGVDTCEMLQRPAASIGKSRKVRRGIVKEIPYLPEPDAVTRPFGERHRQSNLQQIQ